MNENYISNQISDTPDAAPGEYVPDLDVSPAPGDAPSFAPGYVSGSDEVSSGDADPVSHMVSGGDLSDIVSGGDPASQTESLIIQDTAADIASSLASINYTLNAILAFLVFSFCYKRIRSGVKGFTGKGVIDQ